MNQSNRLHRLIELNSKASEVLEFDWYTKGGRVSGDISDEELDARGGIAVNPARLLGTAAVGTGAYYGRKAIKGAGGYSAVAGRVKDAITDATSGIKSTFMKGYQREGGGILRGIRGVARSLTKGKSRFVGLSSRTERLMQLSSALDGVISLSDDNDGDEAPVKSPLKKAAMKLKKSGKGC